jgi:hypothetical protein
MKGSSSLRSFHETPARPSSNEKQDGSHLVCHLLHWRQGRLVVLANRRGFWTVIHIPTNTEARRKWFFSIGIVDSERSGVSLQDAFLFTAVRP